MTMHRTGRVARAIGAVVVAAAASLALAATPAQAATQTALLRITPLGGATTYTINIGGNLSITPAQAQAIINGGGCHRNLTVRGEDPGPDSTQLLGGARPISLSILSSGTVRWSATFDVPRFVLNEDDSVFNREDDIYINASSGCGSTDIKSNVIHTNF